MLVLLVGDMKPPFEESSLSSYKVGVWLLVCFVLKPIFNAADDVLVIEATVAVDPLTSIDESEGERSKAFVFMAKLGIDPGLLATEST